MLTFFTAALFFLLYYSPLLRGRVHVKFRFLPAAGGLVFLTFLTFHTFHTLLTLSHPCPVKCLYAASWSVLRLLHRGPLWRGLWFPELSQKFQHRLQVIVYSFAHSSPLPGLFNLNRTSCSAPNRTKPTT